jgi:hypothetical protein
MHGGHALNTVSLTIFTSMHRCRCTIHVCLPYGGVTLGQSSFDRPRHHYHGGSPAFRVEALCTRVRATAGIPHAGEREGARASYRLLQKCADLHTTSDNMERCYLVSRRGYLCSHNITQRFVTMLLGRS